MDLIHNRLRERGYKGLNSNPLSSALERVLENTQHEDDHDPRKNLNKTAKKTEARKRRRVTHTTSKGIKVNDQHHFKTTDFIHAEVVDKYKAKVAAKADAARKAALVAAATGESFSIEPVPVKKAVLRTPTKLHIKYEVRPTRQRAKEKRVRKKSLHFTHSYDHHALDKFDGVHQKILAEHRKSHAGSSQALSSHMNKSQPPSHHDKIQPTSKIELEEKRSSALDKALANELTNGVRRRSTMKEADLNGFSQSEYELRKGQNRKRRLRKNKLHPVDSAERLDSSRRIKFLIRSTHFTETEVLGLMKIYKLLTEHNNPPGEMGRRHFRSYFQTTFGITDDIMLDQLFHQFDEDNVGSIREHMWIKNLSSMILGSMVEQVNFSYEVYDLNGDGSLGREEIASMLQGCISDVSGSNDDDGVPMTDGEIVEMILKKMDPTRIGYINKDAFRNAVERDPTLIQAFGEVLPSSERLRSFMVIISDANLSEFKSNYTWPGEIDFPKERERYDTQNYKGLKLDPLRKQLAAVNRQIAKISQQQRKSNLAIKKTRLMSSNKSIRFQTRDAK